jgi:hypothetical protein
MRQNETLKGNLTSAGLIKSTSKGRPMLATVLAISDDKRHIGMTRSAGFTPANQILAFWFPANIINRKR